MAEKDRRNEPSVKVEARLMHEADKDEVVIFIGDAPVNVPKTRMPKTYEKLLGMIEKARSTSEGE